jgi:hypothetical protein
MPHPFSTSSLPHHFIPPLTTRPAGDALDAGSPTSWNITPPPSDFSFSSHLAGSQASFLGRTLLSNSFVSATGSSASEARGGGSRLRQMCVRGPGA